jgi:hypothetical protein
MYLCLSLLKEAHIELFFGCFVYNGFQRGFHMECWITCFRRSSHCTGWTLFVCLRSGGVGEQARLPGRVWNMYLERTKRLAHKTFEVLLFGRTTHQIC